MYLEYCQHMVQNMLLILIKYLHISFIRQFLMIRTIQGPLNMSAVPPATLVTYKWEITVILYWRGLRLRVKLPIKDNLSRWWERTHWFLSLPNWQSLWPEPHPHLPPPPMFLGLVGEGLPCCPPPSGGGSWGLGGPQTSVCFTDFPGDSAMQLILKILF